MTKKRTKKGHQKILDIVLLKTPKGLLLIHTWWFYRDQLPGCFWTWWSQKHPVLSFRPMDLLAAPGKRSGDVKKETLHPVPCKPIGAENHLLPEKTASGNIWVSFSRSEVLPGEQISSR